ncbi:hypothetical protein AZE42_08753 [Rhizopogon vesiculosus]|uniref:Protein root UVB sensitive/RUS domain-containing protein n=1 Tax=Rhizopogon vesiculosus TaxID=180088 RepID=A0A1J8PQW7_9AGAM|nr:hypothetical protein AZE42_08753 [Rhizopogon vesiculosus]
MLCGLVAGGPNAALADQFASLMNSKGDVGELNTKSKSADHHNFDWRRARDAHRTLHHDPHVDYTALFVLIVGHLLANYLAVRSVVLRSLNRLRSGVLWDTFRNSIGDVPSMRDIIEKERLYSF